MPDRRPTLDDLKMQRDGHLRPGKNPYRDPEHPFEKRGSKPRRLSKEDREAAEAAARAEFDARHTREFDAAMARERRDAAVQQVGQHADPAWFARALQAVRDVAREAGVDGFTTDDVWARLGGNEPREPRAMGPVMLAASRAGVCRPLSYNRDSTDPQCHARPKRVWVAA